jgi:hypothetical protein
MLVMDEPPTKSVNQLIRRRKTSSADERNCDHGTVATLSLELVLFAHGTCHLTAT